MPRTQIPAGGLRVAEHNLYDFRQVIPTTGNIWFVDSGVSSEGNGLSPEAAFNTLNEARAAATASNGDIIYVMEGHAETITEAAGVALSKAGVTVIGLGRGRNRPVFTFTTAAGASFDISAASVHVENIVLVNGIGSQTAMVNITAADVTVRGCEFQLSDGSTAAVLGILTTDAADRLRIQGNWFHGSAAVTAAIRIVGTDDTRVLENIVTGPFAVTGAIEQVTTAGARHIYAGNWVYNSTANGDNKALVLKNDTTAFVVNNRFAIIDSSGPAPHTGAAAFFGGNYEVGAVDTAGTLV